MTNPLYAHPAPQHDDIAYREAVRLATLLFKKHFAHEEHYASGRIVWEPCDTTAGVISQIDNMVCELVKPTPQRTEERNFCSRCGKRTADLTVIHTCTPPQENT